MEPKARSKFSPRIAFIAPSADDGRTQKHFKDQVNINNILAKYRKTGIIEHVQRARARFGDFTQIFEVAGNLDKVAKAQQTFDMLPAELRNKVGNSIPKFFEFISDTKNLEECYKMGIYDDPNAGRDPGVVAAEKSAAKASTLAAPEPSPSEKKAP